MYLESPSLHGPLYSDFREELDPIDSTAKKDPYCGLCGSGFCGKRIV